MGTDSAREADVPRRRRLRRPYVTVAVVVAVALTASLLTIVARAQLEEDDALPVAVAADVADVDLPPSGLVVSLSRPGFTDLPGTLGVESAFVTSVVAAEPVAAVELLAGGEVVARVLPEEPTVERTDRLTWLPEAEGPVTVLARAYDAKGHVGQSNPLRVDVRAPEPVAGLAAVTSVEGDTLDAIAARYGVTGASVAEWNQIPGVGPADPLPLGTALEVPVALPAWSPTAAATAGRSVPLGSPGRSSVPGGPAAPPPMPAGLALAVPPTLAVAVDGCTATVEATAGEAGQDLVLLQAPPTGGAFVPVAALTGEPVELPVTTGIHDLVVAAGDGGSLAAWSAPVTVPVTDDACSGWDGEVRLDGGRLVADTEADAAYLYLSTTPTEWVRVPAEGFVARGPSGFDFTGVLPPLTGATLAVEAWGRIGAELTFIGRGTFTPPPPKDGAQSPPGSVVSISDAVPLPKVQLWWLRPADWKHAGDPPKAVTAGEVLEPTTLEFQWSAALPGVTHGLVQVTAAPVPAQAGPNPGGVLYLGFAPGHGGTFTIDFKKVVNTFLAKQNGTLIDAKTGLGTQTYQALAGLAGDDSTTSSLPYSPVPIDLDPLDDDEVQELLKQLFVVRVVPMIGDTWTGLVSNDVSLTVDTAGLFPVAPAGEKPYELDVKMVQPPRPPDPWKMSCWQFVGWTDEAELQKKLAEEQAAANAAGHPNLGEYTVWKVLVDAVGSGPICGGCYHFGSLTVAVAGADCSDDDFLDMLWDGFKTFVNMLSSTFAFIKASIVDIVVSATGCKSAGDTAASICSTLATAALDAALISLGIPPSLPNWDQLVAAAKGDIVELGVGLATDLGVPCDEADFAAEIHGQKGLTCEEALSALLDEAVAQIDQLYADTAKSMGFSFPALMKVRPHPSGQVGPAAIEITVNPTKYSAAEGGKTCSVGAYPGAAWAAKIDPFATAAMGKQAGSPIVSGIAPGFTQGTKIGPVLIPQLSWSGKPFETGFWDLPDLPKAGANTYGPASRTYQVYPPAELDPVQVAVLATYTSGMTDAQGKPVVGVSKFWYQWPRHVFLLNQSALFKLLITSGCATGTGLHAWLVPGYGPGLPQVVLNP